jgi:DNA repair protein RecO (recombination protein O)
MKETEQNAFLLHARPFRDNQLIAEFLTQDSGKVSAITYIGTSLKSNKKALLQPFSPLVVVLNGQGNLKKLVRVEASQKSFLLSKDFLYSGFYINELLNKLLPEHIPCEALYWLYQTSLKALSEQQVLEPILRRFEQSLLEELWLTIDYSIVLEHNEAQFYYMPEQGFIPCSDTCKNIRYTKEHLLAIEQQDFTEPAVMRSYKQLMRQILNHLLAGKPLNSRKLFTKK